MAMFQWFCTKCDHSEKKLLPRMPTLGPCPKCGADQDFIDNSTSRIIEERDNGFMHKKVEQLANISELMAERSSKKSGPDTI